MGDIFWGCLKVLIFFLGWMVDAGPEPTYEEKMRVAPLGSHVHNENCTTSKQITKYGKGVCPYHKELLLKERVSSWRSKVFP